MYSLCFTEKMVDDALIRLQNLKALRLPAAQLSVRVGGKESYWFGMLSGTRPFGEKIARKIEDKLGLTRCALDQAKDTTTLAFPERAAKATNDRPGASPQSPDCDKLCRMFETLPEDDFVRAEVVARIATIIKQVKDPPAPQEVPERPGKPRAA